MAHTNRLAESHLQDVMIVISHLSILYVFFFYFYRFLPCTVYYVNYSICVCKIYIEIIQ